jgi:PAS domain S-box-containing protein
MARSPDYLRLATKATRTLAETALDCLREAVVVVDSRAKHLPLVFANAAARASLAPDAEPAAFAETSLYGLLGAESASAMESNLASLGTGAPSAYTLTWRFARGEAAVPTEFQWLTSYPGQRLVMLNFKCPTAPSERVHAPAGSPNDPASREIDATSPASMPLGQREEVFKLAADAVDGVIFEWDLASGHVHRSRGALKVLGMAPGELGPMVDAWRDRIHPRDEEVARRQIGLALIKGSGWTTTYRIRDARGHYRSMLDRGVIQRNSSGDPVRAIGCIVDVSELQRLSDLLGEAQRTAQTGGWEYNYTSRELAWTDELYRIYETSPAEFDVTRESALMRFTPESRQRFEAAWRAAEAGDGQLDLELQIDTLRDQRAWVRMIGHLERIDGRPLRAFGSVQNIHAQKLAQLALEDSGRWLKLSMSMADMYAWRWDKASDAFEFANVDPHSPRTFRRIKEWQARMHPEDRIPVTRAIRAAMAARTDLDTEFRLRAQGAGYRRYATIARPLLDAAGALRGFMGVAQDVTARRESEEKLRRSEELLRATTANTVDTLILVDDDLKIRFINRGSGAKSIEALVGADISTLLPEVARAAVVAKLRRVLASGETLTYEFESRDGAGEPRFFENRAVRVKEEGIGAGVCISVTDITERKRLEREILDVSSRERSAIGRDLHDGLGQELTGIALMLRGHATQIHAHYPRGADLIDEIVRLVNQSIENARALARGLLPVRTDSGGLPFALRELAARGRDLYRLAVNFHSEGWPEITLSEANASHLYRIAQEALTNAARHGQASKVDIVLAVSEHAFSLRITDDGVGIGNPDRPVAGMGLKIMKYRAGMIGAKLEIGAHAPQGTIVSVTGEQPRRAGSLQFGHPIYGGSDYGR